MHISGFKYRHDQCLHLELGIDSSNVTSWVKYNTDKGYIWYQAWTQPVITSGLQAWLMLSLNSCIDRPSVISIEKFLFSTLNNRARIYMSTNPPKPKDVDRDNGGKTEDWSNHFFPGMYDATSIQVGFPGHYGLVQCVELGVATADELLVSRHFQFGTLRQTIRYKFSSVVCQIHNFQNTPGYSLAQGSALPVPGPHPIREGFLSGSPT